MGMANKLQQLMLTLPSAEHENTLAGRLQSTTLVNPNVLENTCANKMEISILHNCVIHALRRTIIHMLTSAYLQLVRTIPDRYKTPPLMAKDSV